MLFHIFEFTIFRRMELILINGFESDEEVISRDAAWEEVETCFDAIDWFAFHILILRKDDENTVEVGGSLIADGLSATITIAGEVFVIDSPPENLRMAKEILRSFYGHPQTALRKYFLKKAEDPAMPILSYKGEGSEIRGWIYGIALASILFLVGYLVMGDEWRFIGRDIDHARAKVVGVKQKTFGGRYYWEIVSYEFVVDGNTYTGTFVARQQKGQIETADELKIRYVKSNPWTSGYVGLFIKLPKPRQNSSLGVRKPAFRVPEPKDSL